MGNIKRLQLELVRLWTDEFYSDEFKTSPLKHKHFDHALKHVFKAAAKLLEITEEIDHSSEIVWDPRPIRKYVADIIISAVRLANVNPTGFINIEEAIFERIERKMGAKIDTEPDLIEVLKKIVDIDASISPTTAMYQSKRWAQDAIAASESRSS